MTAILVAITVINAMTGHPIIGAWVLVSGTSRGEEPVTDSHGRYVVVIEPGVHEINISKPTFDTFSGRLTFTTERPNVTVWLTPSSTAVFSASYAALASR